MSQLMSSSAFYVRVKFTFRIHQLMRRVCAEAVKFDDLLPPEKNNRRVVVILNPTANKRSAEKAFEKYCAPIFHLAGIRVDVVKTESEGFARTYVESELPEFPDAILVAGGDGTLMEVVTGILRRDPSSQCPVGILPVGRTNSVGGRMFFVDRSDMDQVEGLTRAALGVVKGQLTPKDVLQVEVLETQETATEAKKPIYALASIKWGAFRDVMNLRDKYWYYGGLRERAAILFNAFKTSVLNRDCRGTLTLTPPCQGCVNCFGDRSARKVEYKSKNWWSFLMPSTKQKEDASVYLVNGEDVRKKLNPECGQETQIDLKGTTELYLTTSNIETVPENSPPRMLLRTGSSEVASTDWITDSWRRLSSVDHLDSQVLSKPIECRTMELTPEKKEKEEFFSIDNEDFEVKPIRVTLLPARLKVFSSG